MKAMSKLNLKDYELFIFDWDGTLVDSLGIYRDLDKLFVEKFYGVSKPVEYFYKLSNKIKTGAINNSEEDYYRYLDELFGDGKTEMKMIRENIYKYAPIMQAKIDYKPHAHKVLTVLKEKYQKPISLSTSSGTKDIVFYSSEKSKTAKKIKPLEYFDKIVTFDDVKNPKPHPEPYKKITEYFNITPKKTLVFEDSLSGLKSAKSAGMDVIIIFDKHYKDDLGELQRLADYYIEEWANLLSVTEQI
jgi:beta-phosphoglucomutase-like phosphatase (HAD superfamily)